MRISTKGRYSLEALLYMAANRDDSYVSTRTVSLATGISEGYLEQLFIPLRRKGILKGIRGPQGGYVIGRPLEDISAGDILRTVEGSLEPVDCVFSKDCPVKKRCVSHHTWKELYKEISDCVDSISLKDLAAAYDNMDKMEYEI
jgi:Rrf2 family protein